jgi:hypothetical protein
VSTEIRTDGEALTAYFKLINNKLLAFNEAVSTANVV